MKLLVLLIAPLPFAIGTGLRGLKGVEKKHICHYNGEIEVDTFNGITESFDIINVPVNSAHLKGGKHPKDNAPCENGGVLACPDELVPGEDLFYDRECNMYSELYDVCNNELLDKFLANTPKGEGYYCESNDPNESWGGTSKGK